MEDYQNKEEKKWLEKISDKDFEELQNFHNSFIKDLKTKEKEWIEIKADITDEYLKLREEINKTLFKNNIIKGIEQGRLSQYLKECGRLEREILNCSVFIEKLSKDEDSISWLFNDYDKQFKSIKDDLYLVILEIFKEEKLFTEFIELTFKSIVLKDAEDFYNSFIHLLALYTSLQFQTRSKYSILLTELLFGKKIPLKKKPDILTSTSTKYGHKLSYKRKHKK